MIKYKYSIMSALLVALIVVSCSTSSNTPDSAIPVINSIKPDSGTIGTVVTINGKNFSPNKESDKVSFGEAQAKVVNAASRQLKVKVPEDLKAEQKVYVTVTVGNRTGESTSKFTVLKKPEYKLVWQDNFDGNNLDTNKWDYRGLGPRRDAYNDKSSVFVKDGKLYIKAYSDSVNGERRNYTGMIATKRNFKYGKIKARISFKNQPGSWSAFWLQSPTYGNPIGEPEKAGMEIDIVESLPYHGKAHEALHWDGYGKDHKTATNWTKPIGANSGNFKIYSLEWAPDYYKFYIDGKLMWKYTKVVSHRSEYIILSTEVEDRPAGNWAGPIPTDGYGSLKTSKTIMKVDYVKCYRLADK
jgi:beta-glucanase (GH16 family)